MRPAAIFHCLFRRIDSLPERLCAGADINREVVRLLMRAFSLARTDSSQRVRHDVSRKSRRLAATEDALMHETESLKRGSAVQLPLVHRAGTTPETVSDHVDWAWSVATRV